MQPAARYWPFGGNGARVVPGLYGEPIGVEMMVRGENGEPVIFVQRLENIQDNIGWEAADRRNYCIAAVIVMILMLIGLIIFLVLTRETGKGKADKGAAFTQGSDKLRLKSSDRLAAARPCSWHSAAGGSAEAYEDKIYQQQLRVALAAEADRQLAEVVAAQANHVEQGRQDLQDTLDSLSGGIPVAAAMHTQWAALAAIGSPTAPAVEAALVMFGKTLGCSAITSALGVCSSLTDAGTQTQQALDQVIETYRWIVDDVAALMPTGGTPHLGANTSTVLAPTTSSSDSNSPWYNLPSKPDATGTVSDAQDHRISLGALIGQPSRDSRTSRRAPSTPTFASRASRHTPHGVHIESRSAALTPAAGGDESDRNVPGVPYNMQDTQPSTSVPSNAI